MQEEEKMIAAVHLFMPRISIVAWMYILLHLPIALIAKTPSLSLGAVISTQIRKWLRDPAIMCWQLPDDIAGTLMQACVDTTRRCTSYSPPH